MLVLQHLLVNMKIEFSSMAIIIVLGHETVLPNPGGLPHKYGGSGHGAACADVGVEH